MTLRIESSPKLRDARSRTPPEVVTPNLPRKRRRNGAWTPLWLKALTLALLIGGAGWWANSSVPGPDPHYVQARSLVDHYEYGKSKPARNYGHRVYSTALEELALVPPDSISHDAATALEREIERGREEFKQRQATLERRINESVTLREQRYEMELEARQRAKEHPVTEFPECDEDHAH